MGLNRLPCRPCGDGQCQRSDASRQGGRLQARLELNLAVFGDPGRWSGWLPAAHKAWRSFEKQMVDQKKKVVSPQEPAAAATASDKLFFYCPHCTTDNRLQALAEMAGKKKKCPKCHEIIVVPSVSEPKRPSGDAKSLQPPAQPSAEPPAQPSAVPPAEPAEEFGFLKDEPTQEPVDPVVLPTDFLTPAQPSLAVSAEESSAHVMMLASTQPEAFVELISNPTALLLARMWDEREQGGIVEIHLTGGGVIKPDGFDEQWSRGTHALFANRTADDKIVLTAVAWDTVQKIIVRHVEFLPDGMFHGMDPEDKE